MKMTKLTTPEDFIKIKKNDLLIVQFEKPIYPFKNKVDAFRVYLNKIESDEIILNKKYNVYFNWKMLIDGCSNTLSVYKAIDTEVMGVLTQ